MHLVQFFYARTQMTTGLKSFKWDFFSQATRALVHEVLVVLRTYRDEQAW